MLSQRQPQQLQPRIDRGAFAGDLSSEEVGGRHPGLGRASEQSSLFYRRAIFPHDLQRHIGLPLLQPRNLSSDLVGGHCVH